MDKEGARPPGAGVLSKNSIRGLGSAVRWTHRMIAVDACRPALVTPRNHMLLYERCYAVGSVTDGGPNVLGSRLQILR
jgi:hypothetical protein